MARRLFSSSVLFSLCLTGYCLAAEYERRIWTDKSGKHQISATFIDVIDGKVRLERPNGDISRVPLEKLSKADREYVASAGKPEEEPEPETPVLRGLQVGDKIEIDQAGRWQLGTVVEIDYKFEIVKVQVPGAPFPYRAHGVEELRDPKTLQQPILVKPASPVSALKTIRPDYTKMDRLLADGKSADRIAADPLERPESLWSPRAVRLGGQAGILGSLSRPSDFAITYSPTPMAMVVFAAPGVGEEGPSQVELVDLTSRKSVLKGPAPPGTGKVRISPGGGSLATLAAENIGARSNGRVAFWKLKDKDISHWISFSPYVMNSWPDAEPQWVAWLDEEKFLSVNQEGQLILWQVENAQAIYEMQ
ncbi:MAG: hypothetical protein KDA57_15745, partial [Planctomycetales bacterium]|nr:hypothetical protein [Planctomycetales bacterium]